MLGFQRPAQGLREEQTGEEEFLFDLIGELQDRQVLLWPESAAEQPPDTATTAAGPDVPVTPVSETPSPPQSLGPSPAQGTQLDAAEQPAEPAESNPPYRATEWEPAV